MQNARFHTTMFFLNGKRIRAIVNYYEKFPYNNVLLKQEKKGNNHITINCSFHTTMFFLNKMDDIRNKRF